VLRAAYALDTPTIDASLRGFLALKNISPADPVLTQRTLDAYSTGVDFADAMHAAQCPDGERFATFDKAFAKRAAKAGLRRVALLKV
jgi:predicted nucleic acid-binding protein